MISIQELLKAGVHFGHQPRRWNPKMKEYIFGERNGVYIIDLQKTQKKFDEAYEFLKKTAAEGKSVLFVGTKPQSQESIVSCAKACKMFYVSHRWLGGMLTNFSTIKKSINRLKKLDELLDGEIGQGLAKKEFLRLNKKRTSMNKTLSGVKDMGGVPGVIVVIDPRKEHIAVEEGRKLDIPIVGLVDTNCNPDKIDYVIPGNDDSLRSVQLIISKLKDAVNEGLQIKEEKDAIARKIQAAEAKKEKQNRVNAQKKRTAGGKGKGTNKNNSPRPQKQTEKNVAEKAPARKVEAKEEAAKNVDETTKAASKAPEEKSVKPEEGKAPNEA